MRSALPLSDTPSITHAPPGAFPAYTTDTVTRIGVDCCTPVTPLANICRHVPALLGISYWQSASSHLLLSHSLLTSTLWLLPFSEPSSFPPSFNSVRCGSIAQPSHGSCPDSSVSHTYHAPSNRQVRLDFVPHEHPCGPV